MSYQCASLFLNGSMPLPERVNQLIRPDDLIVAVDGGIRHTHQLALTPHLLIGDLDSAPKLLVNAYLETGGKTLKSPTHKDETDTEMALNYMLELGINSIKIFGALGGRTDHALANLSLIFSDRYHHLSIEMINGLEHLSLLGSETEIAGEPGDLLSLLPWGCNQVDGICTEGLSYPLVYETLYSDHSRGISNVFTQSTIKIRFASGRLLCIHTFQK